MQTFWEICCCCCGVDLGGIYENEVLKIFIIIVLGLICVLMSVMFIL